MSSRWPRAVVPFELNNRNSRLKEDAVRLAMEKIERKTCVRFVFSRCFKFLMIYISDLFQEKRRSIRNI